MKTHSFTEQKRKGQIGELILDRCLRTRYLIEEADDYWQRCEVDRIVTPINGGLSWRLEYKTDLRADETGNAFIETLSVDRGRKAQGWSVKSRADILIYFLPFSGRIYICPLNRLRAVLPRWLERYEVRSARNQRYCTHGLLIPLWELAAASELARIPPQDPQYLE